MISEYIEIHKKTIVNTICLTIVVICTITIIVLSLPPSYSKELQAIDLVCDTAPIKADSLLYAYKKANKNMSSNDKWYCRFLTLKSNVKQNKDITDDKRIMYDYISLAWTYKAMDKNVAAISCLKRAKDISQKEFPGNNLVEIYSQIADAYYKKDCSKRHENI